MIITVESLHIEGRNEDEKQSLKGREKFHIVYATGKWYSNDGRTGKAENETWKVFLREKEELKITKQKLLLCTVYLGIKLLIMFRKLLGFC